MVSNTKSEQYFNQGPIYEDMSLYKVIRTKQGRLNILHFDGSVSVIIPFKGINNTSLVEADFERMYESVQFSLDKIDDINLSIQFLMVRTNDVVDVKSEHLPSYLQPRAEFVKRLASNYQLFRNEFYFCLHYANLGEKKRKTLPDLLKKWALSKDFSQESYEKNMMGLGERISNLSENTDLMLNVLSDIGTQPRVLQTEQQIYDILQKFTRPKKSRQEKLDIDQDHEVPRQALFSGVDAQVYKDHFVMDGFYHKVFSLDRAPKKMIFGRTIDVIESVEFEMIYSVTFRLMSNKEAIDTFRLRQFEEGIKLGSDKDSIAPDKTKQYEYEKVDENYEDFVRGEGRGVSVCPVLVLRVQEDFVDKMSKRMLMSREEYLKKLEQDLTKRVFNQFGSSEWIGEHNTQWMMYCHIIPGMSNIHSLVMRDMMLSTENIPYFLAIYDNQREHIQHNGTNHFIDLRGNLFKFMLKDPDLAAWNYSISGQTGSGKSVLVNALLTMQFSEAGNPPVICILDVGGDRGSYSKFMDLVGGSKINLSGAIKPSIQLFKIIPERSRPTPNKIQALAKLVKKESDVEFDLKEIEIRVKNYYNEFLEKGGNNLTDYLRKELFKSVLGFDQTEKLKDAFELKEGECEPDEQRMALIMSILDVILSSNKKDVDGFRYGIDEDMTAGFVLETYRFIGEKENRFPKMSDFYKVVEAKLHERSPKDNQGNSLMSQLDTKMLAKLYNWTENGQYTMFDRESSIDLDASNVILADLKGLESDKQLQLIYTMLISQLFSDKMYFIKDRRKIIIRDEAWSLMVNDKARAYFESDLRTARKNGFVTISVSQLPIDYNKPDPAVGKAIISNMQVQIFCKFTSRSVCEEVAREFHLPEEMIDDLQSLGVQSETMSDASVRKTYAKFMMIAEYGSKRSIYILKNLLHPFEYNLYSSSSEDNAVIDYYLKVKRSHKTLEEVLWYITQGEHIGDQELYKYLVNAGETNKAQEVLGKTKR